MSRKKTINIENARIGFRNFGGAEGKCNPAGKRNFCVFLDTDFAETLIDDGWNVRWLQPKDDNDEKQAYLQVAVSYNTVEPKIVLISGAGKTILKEDNVNVLDWADIETVDLILTPYHWNVSGKSGIKAYVKSMYVTIQEDEFEQKYYDVPDSASNTVTYGN